MDSDPEIKPQTHFTGKGTEFIGDPQNGRGVIQYNDGRCFGIQSAGRLSGPPPPSGRKITEAKLAAWYNLERKHRLAHPPENPNSSTEVRRERRAEATANDLAKAFADAMLRGELIPFIRSVEDATATDIQSQKNRLRRKHPHDGIKDALAAIAYQSTHPEQVTISAIVDFLKADEEFRKHYDITESMLKPREVGKHLDSMGFEWLGKGRKRGRPPGKK